MEHPSRSSPTPKVEYAELVSTFGAIGLQSFGGPAGQIAVMHRVLVEQKRWLGESQFLHALQFCMFLPGPEAMQLATYAGWLLGGLRGAIVAGGLFIAPGFVALLALSLLYSALAGAGLVASVFLGVKAAVVAIIIEALVRVARRALKTRAAYSLAAASFVALYFFAAPFPLVVAIAALIGAVSREFGAAATDVLVDDGQTTAERWRATLVTLGSGAVIWLAPVAVLVALTGWDSVWTRMTTFFAGAAVVTFGGAYAVLAYVAQWIGASFAWVSPGVVLDGLALAESTPGPLIMVVQFVAYHVAYGAPGALSPTLAGTIASLLTVWVTFVPSFVLVLAGAPWMERLRARPGLNSALGAVMAAVVGVIANLSVYVGLHALFAEVTLVRVAPWTFHLPEPGSLDWRAVVLVALAGALLGRRHGLTLALVACTVVGFALATIWP